MNCLCGHGEYCEYCEPSFRAANATHEKEVSDLKKALQQVVSSTEKLMGETASGSTLLSLRWIRKVAAMALGEADD